MFRSSILLTAGLCALCFCLSASAGQVTRHYQFAEPVLTPTAEGIQVTLEGTIATGDPGQPLLPAAAVHLLLPPGEEAVSVKVDLSDPVMIGDGYDVLPAEQPRPISDLHPVNTWRDENIYSQDHPFPAEAASGLCTHFVSGHGIATVLVFPVVYRPLSGELAYYPSVTVTITSRPTTKAQQSYSQLLKHTPMVVDRIRAAVDNPELTAVYPATRATDTEQWDLLVITTNDFLAFYDDFIDYKNRHGFATAVATVEDIYSSYTGIDSQDKIRNCIIDYYQNYDIQYVLLAGDHEQIPCRQFYVAAGGYEADIPSDLYYAGLDGSWNDDGDDLWGELEEADFFAEVYVGRSCADNQVEIINFTQKTMSFQSSPVVAEVETALMLGEDMGWSSWGWEYKEEVRLGSDNFGYTTAGFPANFDVDTLYENENYSWSALNDLLPRLNDGPTLVNHMGHAGWDYALKFNVNQVNDNNFTNNGLNHNFFIGYSQGCFCGNFSHTGEDCIIEAFTTIACGAVSFVANSRYGWGVSSGTNGASQRFDREFFDALFGEEISRIGWTNQDSKEDNAAWAADAYIRWCYYELNLFGDPTLDIWTSEPGTFSPDYPEGILYGATTFDVSGISTIGARATLSQDGVILGQGVSDFTSTASIELAAPLQQTGTLDLVITAHDMLPYSGTVDVLEPYITLTPSGPPISLPASGGSFDFSIEVGNTGDLEAVVDIWCDLTLPDSSSYGPVIGPVTGFTFPAGWFTSRDRTQNIPGGAPAGTYSYNAYVGLYPDLISSSDQFSFEKTGVDEGSANTGWFCDGDLFNPEAMEAAAPVPAEFRLHSAYPNPFNPTTTIAFDLPVASPVKLSIFSVNGARVGNQNFESLQSGHHTLTFDGSHLPSGIYIFRLTAGEYSAVNKLLLIK